jgi:hypothetical protein
MKKMIATKEYAKGNPLVWKRVRDDSFFPIDIISCMSLYKNIVIIQDSITKDVVLIASLTPFFELKKLPEDFQAMEKLSTELIGVSRHASPVTNNKAHQDGGGLGHMFAVGWHVGFSREFSFQR